MVNYKKMFKGVHNFTPKEKPQRLNWGIVVMFSNKLVDFIVIVC